jgi:hypothetical protein
MVNGALLMSLTLPLAVPTITLPCVVGLFGTVQEYEPAEAAVFETTVVHEEPLLVENRILTFAIPEEVHVMA